MAGRAARGSYGCGEVLSREGRKSRCGQRLDRLKLERGHREASVKRERYENDGNLDLAQDREYGSADDG